MILRFIIIASFLLESGHAADIADLPLPSADLLEKWHETKAAEGTTFAGSPSWQAHMAFIEAELAARGVVDQVRHPVPYRRWFASDERGATDRSLAIEGQTIPVAAYWAYSGSTGEKAVTAPLQLFDKKAPAEALRGKIVVFQVGDVPESMLNMFGSGHEYANYEPVKAQDGIASSQWYQGNFVIRFGKFDEKLRNSGAAGAVVIFDMPFERAEGLYTFPLLRPGTFGVPGLYLDRDAGEAVLAAARAGKSATLRLNAKEKDAKAYFLHGFLPGKNYGTDKDEFVLLITHSDGPNLTQENGTLGILGVIDALKNIPTQKRQRSVLVLFDPQHYMPGRHQVEWMDEYPDIESRIVASIGVEQLGQREYAETDDGYGMNGLAEPTLIFVQENDALINAAITAVKKFDPPRTEVRVPSRGGQGMWQGLGDVAIKHNMPGYAISSNMSGFWTTTPGMESFDKDLCYRQIGVLTALTQELMSADLEDIAVPVIDPKKNPAMSPGVDR